MKIEILKSEGSGKEPLFVLVNKGTVVKKMQ